MQLSQDVVYKFLLLGGLVAGLLLLANLQFLFAGVLFIIAGISYFMWKKNQ